MDVGATADLFGATVETTVGAPIRIREATRCAFVPFTPVPRIFAGQWVRLVVCDPPEDPDVDEEMPVWDD